MITNRSRILHRCDTAHEGSSWAFNGWLKSFNFGLVKGGYNPASPDSSHSCLQRLCGELSSYPLMWHYYRTSRHAKVY